MSFQSARAALCLHGFTGTPQHVQPMADRLARDGWLVEAPMLSGHGGSLRDLAESDWREWYFGVETALHSLRARAAGPVAIVGFSTGGLLALRLVLEHPETVSALALLAVPMRLKTYEERGVRLLLRLLPEWVTRSPKFAWPKFGGSDCGDEHARKQRPTHEAMPLRGIGSLLTLRDELRPRLRDVRQPAMVAHGLKDGTIPAAASHELIGSLGSDVIESAWFPRSRHLLFHDVEREEVIACTASFLGAHAGH